MPLVSFTSEKEVALKSNTIERLKQECLHCSLLSGKTADATFVYTVTGCSLVNSSDPMMLAFAHYNGTFAVYTPSYLTGKQLVIYEYFLRDEIKPHETIIVFSKKDYEAIQKYRYSKPINVKLCV